MSLFQLLMRYILTVSLCFTLLAPAQAQVFLLDTKAQPSTRQFFDSFKRACSNCGEIIYKDGEGNPKRLKAKVSEIAFEKNAVTIATGTPAAKAIMEEPRLGSVITAFASALQADQNSLQVHALPTELHIDWTISLARKIVGDQVKIAIIGGSKTAATAKQSASLCDQHCRIMIVSDPSSLPETLQEAYMSADFVVLLKDSTIINRQSVDFLVKTAIANNKFTLGFSKSLASMGVSFAISPDYTAQGERAAQIVHAAQTNSEMPAISALQDFKLHVNCAATKRVMGTREKYKFTDPCTTKSIEIGALGAISLQYH